MFGEVAAQEVADEALDFVVKLFRMEASHDAHSNHVRVDHVLLHHLPLCALLLLLHFELGVLRDTLDDGECDPRVFLDVVLAEVFKGIVDVGHIRRIVAVALGEDAAHSLAFRPRIGGELAVVFVQSKHVVELLLATCPLHSLALDHLLQPVRYTCLDLLLERLRHLALDNCIGIVELFVASRHTEVEEALRVDPLDDLGGESRVASCDARHFTTIFIGVSILV